MEQVLFFSSSKDSFSKRTQLIIILGGQMFNEARRTVLPSGINLHPTFTIEATPPLTAGVTAASLVANCHPLRSMSTWYFYCIFMALLSFCKHTFWRSKENIFQEHTLFYLQLINACEVLIHYYVAKQITTNMFLITKIFWNKSKESIIKLFCDISSKPSNLMTVKPLSNICSPSYYVNP